MNPALRPYLAAILAPLIAWIVFWISAHFLPIPDPLTLAWLVGFVILVSVLHIWLASAIKPPAAP